MITVHFSTNVFFQFWCSIEQWSSNSHMNQSEKLIKHTLNFQLTLKAYLTFLGERTIFIYATPISIVIYTTTTNNIPKNRPKNERYPNWKGTPVPVGLAAVVKFFVAFFDFFEDFHYYGNFVEKSIPSIELFQFCLFLLPALV